MIVIDSSVFASLIVKDEFYEVCKKFVTGRKATVDLAYAEVGNVLWKHVKIGRIPVEEVAKRVELLVMMIGTSKVFKTKELLPDAVKLAVNYGVTVYDALFVSLALKLNAELVTTDSKLYEKLRGTGLENHVKLIRK